MDDGGVTITGIAIGGTALTAIGGVMGAWIRARYGRTEIRPQPLEVAEALVMRVAEHDKDISWLKSRVESNEAQLGLLMEEVREGFKELRREVKVFDEKAEARASATHKRIDQIKDMCTERRCR